MGDLAITLDDPKVNIPETGSEIKQAARLQIARQVELSQRDRDDPRLETFPNGDEITAALDDLVKKLHDLETIILDDLPETHP